MSDVENKNKGGRPKKWGPQEVKAIQMALENYIDNTDIPIVAEFAYMNNLSRQSLYDYSEEFSSLLEKAISKKEAALERKALNGDVNVSMAIFSLKQLGWSDKRQHEFGNLDEEPFVIKISQNVVDAIS